MEATKTIQGYNYEWATAEAIIANRSTQRQFGGWGEYDTLNKIADNPTEEDCKNAHELWLKLKVAFNKEAKHYDPETNHSLLGSIGAKNDREVCRADWWTTLKAGKTYGEDKYDTLTSLIEALHGGEKLETGRISFGS